MRLNALDGLASIGPDLDLSVLSTGVAPAFLIEGDAGEKSRRVLAAHDTWLLQTLGHICWVPEANLFRRDRGEAEIIGTLGPGDINNAIS